MRLSVAGTIKRFAIAAAALASCTAMGQAAFRYTATDYQAETLLAPAPLSFSVKTVIVVGPGFNSLPQISGPTKSVSLTLQPPPGAVTLMRVTLDNKIAATTVNGSNADGELEISVALPVGLDASKILKVEWKSADGSVFESTVNAG